ncbi:MAG: membrane protein insertion efficiency factor YidD [Patescibacteria group bacterium]
MKEILINLIEFYQKYLSFDRGILMFLAPFGACKNAPTCSEYTKESIQRFGVYKGVLLGLKRLWGCR